MVIHCPFKEMRPYLDAIEQRFGLAEWAKNNDGFSLHYDDQGLSLKKRMSRSWALFMLIL